LGTSGGAAEPGDRAPVWGRLFGFSALFVVLVVPGLFLRVPGTIGSTAGILIAALVGGWVMLAVDGLPPAALGFHGKLRVATAEAGVGTLGGVGVGLVALLLMVAVGGLGFRFTGTEGLIPGALAALWFFALPAAAEEALFRGYPLQVMARAWGGTWALVISGVAFGLLHGRNPEVGPFGLLNILGAGVFLGAIQLRTGSLWMASGVHLGWNWALGFLADLPVSGLDVVDNPALAPVLRGPEWITGGAFGPEAGLAGAVALWVAAAWAIGSRRLSASRAVNLERVLVPPMGPGLKINRGVLE
jgi:membrane protease YdiL (CAAX protease family)